uniref:Alpha/beta hydrolase n=1 Tax=Echinostoma caproni TaxID=27848 RepID=A0A183A3B8_9TREM
LRSTDPALSDPCTGMELVEKVDTATWLACWLRR